MEDTVELGGNIELSGFSVLDGGTMIILKKIVGNYAKKFSERCSNFEKLNVTMIHDKEEPIGFELHAKLINSGNPMAAEVTDKNLFFALDNVLKKVESMIK